jgi:hypothetical protein
MYFDGVYQGEATIWDWEGQIRIWGLLVDILHYLHGDIFFYKLG